MLYLHIIDNNDDITVSEIWRMLVGSVGRSGGLKDL